MYIRVLQADISCEITQDTVYGAICKCSTCHHGHDI